MTQTEIKTRTKTDISIVEPPMYKVLSVSQSLDFKLEYFDYTVQLANEKTLEVHEAGSAAVAILPYEIAEQKGIEVTMSARTQGYPLMIKIEPQT